MKNFLKRAVPLGLLCTFLHLSASTVLAQAQAIITTHAGGGGLPIVNGGLAISQSIGSPSSVVSDRAGGFYFASDDHRVYRVRASGVLTVIAGNGVAGFSGDDGLATSAQLNYPNDVAVDGNGNVFIADGYNYRVRKVTPDGIIRTFAGNGNYGSSGDSGPGTAARLGFPTGVALDASGAVFISDSTDRVRKVAPNGIISTVAGSGLNGFSGDGGPATSARLSYPSGVAVDANGNLFIADYWNSRIRKVNAGGIISTVAGGGSGAPSGDGGPATSAQLGYLLKVVVDTAGNFFIVDGNDSRIRKVTAAGIIDTVAGSSTSGYSGDGGPATSAQLGFPQGAAVDAAGNIFIADSRNKRIRKVAPTGIISTVAGIGTFAGDGGLGISALLFNPTGVAVDGTGNVFIADYWNSRVRKVAPDGIISAFAGNGTSGMGGDGGPAALAELLYPAGVAVDNAGNVFIADCAGPIRKVTPTGVISTFASLGAWRLCIEYETHSVSGIAVDAAGNLIVVEPYAHRVHKVTPAGVISTLAGNGASGFSGDGGPAVSAHLNYPAGVAVDGEGNVFIVDLENNRIRKVSASGIISTVAGNGLRGFSGDGGPAISARLGETIAVAADSAGNIFITGFDNRIRQVNSSGIISTVAGDGSYDFSGDGGPAIFAQLSGPSGLAVDALGNLFIADTYNNRIRRIGLGLTVPTLAAVSPALGSQGSAVSVTLSGASFKSPLAVNAGSGIDVSDVTVVTQFLATATLTIAPDAILGPRNVTVTTNLGTSVAAGFTVVEPFPDLSITSSHAGTLAVGFDGVYVVTVVNLGRAATVAPMTITDVLPFGVTFVSGTGGGWTCGTSEAVVTCTNPAFLAPNASTALTLTVAVGAHSPAGFVHVPRVAVAGDLLPSNDTASDLTTVATLAARLQFDSADFVAGRQSTLELTLPTPFPIDVRGTLRLTFVPDTVIRRDDPATQFATGGREVGFIIPANTLAARFGPEGTFPAIGFQPGTIAGTLTFTGTIQASAIETTFSTSQSIPVRAPVIQAIRTDTEDGLAVVITLLSTPLEVATLNLRFDTKPAVDLSCGTVASCRVFQSSLVFDVKSMFNAWFSGSEAVGSLSTIRLPFAIQGDVHGTVWVTFNNSRGMSNVMSFPLP